MYSDNKARKVRYMCKKEGALVEVKSANWSCRIERINPGAYKGKECNRTGSGDYKLLQYPIKWKQRRRRDQRWTWTAPSLMDRTVRNVNI
jgi:hypothetical protein